MLKSLNKDRIFLIMLTIVVLILGSLVISYKKDLQIYNSAQDHVLCGYLEGLEDFYPDFYNNCIKDIKIAKDILDKNK
jgi:hypothetical protein